MKKALVIALFLGIAALTAGAFAKNRVYVTYSNSKAMASVSHLVTVKIPKVVVLEVRSTDGRAAVVSFDFTGTAGLAAYQQALFGTGSNPISFSSAYGTSNLQDVRVMTNSAGGARVKVAIAAKSGKLSAKDVLFKGHDASRGWSTSVKAAKGWQVLATTNDFSIKADQTATPGSASFTVTYTAVAN